MADLSELTSAADSDNQTLLAAREHLFAADYSTHQRFHVLWEASKYAAASMLALFIIFKPLAAGERWAVIAIALANLLLFGGVLVGALWIGGVPASTFWATSFFLAASVPALAVLWPRRRES